MKCLHTFSACDKALSQWSRRGSNSCLMASAISSVPFTNSAILPTQFLSTFLNNTLHNCHFLAYQSLPSTGECNALMCHMLVCSSSLTIKSQRAQQHIHAENPLHHSLIKTCWLHYNVTSTSLKQNCMSPPFTWLVQPINWIQGQCVARHMMAAINKKPIVQIQTLFPLQY